MRVIGMLAAVAVLAGASQALGQGAPFVRMEMLPVESMTLSGESFLAGEQNGKRVTLAGELRLPKPAPEKMPAVILVHGSGGLSASPDAWAREINSIGVATFI